MQVPAPFGYERASSVQHALVLLEQLGPEARLLAGGHSLLPMMKLRLASPEYVIDIDPLADELGYIAEREGEIRIGAMTRHRALQESELLRDRLTIFTDAERVIADPVVRNRGTIGDALCQADPSEDLSAVCAAVGATLVIRSSGGERVVDMLAFHRGPYASCDAPPRGPLNWRRCDMHTAIGASTGWTVGLVLGIVVILVAAAIVITIVALAQRIATQARTAVAGVQAVREQTDGLSGIARINDSGVRILRSARALRKVAVGR